MEAVIPFADLPSSTPESEYRSSKRIDPYWGGLWERGSSAHWVSREHLGRLEEAKIAGKRAKHLDTDPDVARGRILNHWQAKLDLLSVITNWRTVTAEQFAAFTGRGLHIRGAQRVLSDLFALDIIDYGSLWAGGTEGELAARGRLIRPADSHAFDQLFRPRMSYAEWVSVTAGKPYLTGGQFDRHNILTNEIALRVAEHLDVGTVLGERQAVVNDIMFTAVGADIPADLERSQQVGDAVIVRPDGVRIVVETTATWSRSGKMKAEMWARAMARRPFEETGVVVVFVVADHPDPARRKSVANDVRKTVSAVTRVAPGTLHSRTADRMFVVDWQDWFPSSGEASIDFLDLRAKRPNGPDGAWQDAALLDTSDIPSPDPRLTAVSHTASGLRLVPHQLREGRRKPSLVQYPVRRFGLDEIPQLLLDPRTGAPREKVGIARGARPATRPPARMRY